MTLAKTARKEEPEEDLSNGKVITKEDEGAVSPACGGGNSGIWVFTNPNPNHDGGGNSGGGDDGSSDANNIRGGGDDSHSHPTNRRHRLETLHPRPPPSHSPPSLVPPHPS
nr:unnamed protein product [Spirometra erinaceieuropaei]